MFNGTDVINQPWNTTFAPYIHLMGGAWLVVPVLFIGAALYVKTKDTALLGIYLTVIGALLGASGSLTGSPMVICFIIAALGVGVLFYQLFYGVKS